MAKAYWVVTYRKIKDPEKLAAYAKLAGPAIQSMGGKFIVRGTPAKTYEGGLNERTVVSEWPDLQRGDRGLREPRLQGSAARTRRRRRARPAHRRRAA